MNLKKILYHEFIKLTDKQTKHNQTRMQYDEFLKSLVYKWNPLLWI